MWLLSSVNSQALLEALKWLPWQTPKLEASHPPQSLYLYPSEDQLALQQEQEHRRVTAQPVSHLGLEAFPTCQQVSVFSQAYYFYFSQLQRQSIWSSPESKVPSDQNDLNTVQGKHCSQGDPACNCFTASTGFKLKF